MGKQNKEFQMTVSDQRETQKLLKAALNVLQDFYKKSGAAAFVQKQEPAGPAPPPGFEGYKKNAASGGVMGMIEQIISDAKAMEAKAETNHVEAKENHEGVMLELEQLSNYDAELHQ